MANKDEPVIVDSKQDCSTCYSCFPIEIPTTVTPYDYEFLISAWVLGGVGIYLVALTIILLLRQCFTPKGICTDTNCCGKPDDSNDCCACCLDCAQVCNCTAPSVKSFCDALCGQRRRCDIDDCLACDCFGGCCEESTSPLCPELSCPSCPSINCQSPECDEIVCCCIRISVMASPS